MKASWPLNLRGVRLPALLLAAACALLALFDPYLTQTQRRFDVLFVVDITGSMMVRDYRRGGEPESRLERVKSSLQSLLAELPCGSRAGLAIFSERQPFLLIAPVETCANFAPLAGAIDRLDWRMAWEGDSFIAQGTFRTIALAEHYQSDVVFFTDGHEAPPLHFSGPPPFEGEPGLVGGFLVGAGDDALSPIPKFDEEGREVGFLAADEVVQENRVGLPPPDVQQREGYEPRNAPWGAAAATGDEHLSSVREAHLRYLADATGLGYVRLGDRTDLAGALARYGTPREILTRHALAPWLAGLGLASLLFAWGVVPLYERIRRGRAFPVST